MKFLLISFLVFMTSCSSLKKSLVYSGLGFGLAGGLVGSTLSPDKYSKPHNTAIGASVGVLLGAGVAYMLWKDNPENMDLKTMIIPREKINEGDTFQSPTFVIPKSSHRYKVEELDIAVPPEVKAKLPKPNVIEHLIPEREVKMENGRTISIEEHKAWEVLYE